MTDEKLPQKMDEEQAKKTVANFRPNPAFSMSLIPKNIGDAMQMANVLAKSNAVPKEMIGRPESCFVAIGFGMEVGLPPMQAVQNIMVVNGRPTIWGDAAHALVIGSGQVDEFEEDAPDKALKQGFGRCRIRLKGRAAVERRFSVDDAKRAQLWNKTGPWQTYPGRMLQMRARSWAERDAAPFVLKGIQTREEVEDYEIIHPPVQMPKPQKSQEDAQDAILADEAGPTPTEAPKGEIQPVSGSNPAAPAEGTEPGLPDPDLKVTEKRRKELFRARNRAGVSLKKAKEWFKEKGLTGTSELTNRQADEFEAWLAQNPDQ